MREAAKLMILDASQTTPEVAMTLGVDKGYDTAEFVQALQALGVAPHVARNMSNRRSAVPDEVAASDGCKRSIGKLEHGGVQPGADAHPGYSAPIVRARGSKWA